MCSSIINSRANCTHREGPGLSGQRGLDWPGAVEKGDRGIHVASQVERVRLGGEEVIGFFNAPFKPDL